MRLVVVGGHPGEPDHQKEREDHQPDQKIGADQHREVGILHRLKLCIAEQSALGGVKRIHLCLNELHGNEHPQQGPHRIEGLSEIQPTGRGLLRPHREDVGVGAGLQKRQPAGQNEVGEQKGIVGAGHLRREEEQRAERVQPQSHQNPRLVGESADEHRRWKRHREIAAVEGDLHQRSVGHAHAEDLRKRLHHRIGDVVGEAPQGKTRSDQNKRQHVTDAVRPQQ